MKVLVLGGTGVISRAIVEELLREGHQVAIYNRASKKIAFTREVQQISCLEQGI